jgi:hypothetical protein
MGPTPAGSLGTGIKNCRHLCFLTEALFLAKKRRRNLNNEAVLDGAAAHACCAYTCCQDPLSRLVQLLLVRSEWVPFFVHFFDAFSPEMPKLLVFGACKKILIKCWEHDLCRIKNHRVEF